LLMSSLINALLSEDVHRDVSLVLGREKGYRLFEIGLLTCTWGGRQ
jgi:hypothetical protein